MEFAPSIQVNDWIILQPPLSRRGKGPGLVLLVDDTLDLSTSPKSIDPPPQQKWAEEGFAVAQIVVPATADPSFTLKTQLLKALNALTECPNCDEGKFGVIAFLKSAPSGLSRALAELSEFSAVVLYGDIILRTTKPLLVHGGAIDQPTDHRTNIRFHEYQNTFRFFTIPCHADYNPSSAALSHSNTLKFIKPLLGGPNFDLEAIWDEHTLYEFGTREVDKTMSTMVQEPYVNHIPTITGGIGREKLSAFYRDHFIFNNPEDTGLTLVSRTTGIDRVVDEFLFHFTHDKVIDWMLPGLPPTGKKVSIPFTSVVNVRGDRLFHEHIAWDQASVLRQLGLMPEYLPFPYPLPDGRKPAPGKRFEYRVPTAGHETGHKLVDESSVESNGMFAFDIREVDDV